MNTGSWLFRATLVFLPVFAALAAQPAPPGAPTNPPTAPTEPLQLVPVDTPTPTNLKAQIYKWTGADGKVYYGNVRPNGIAQVEMIAIEPPPPPSAPNSMALTAQLRRATASLQTAHPLQLPSSSSGSSSSSGGSSGDSAPYKDPLDRAREEREALREQERARQEQERVNREQERQKWEQDHASKWEPSPTPSRSLPPPPPPPAQPTPMPFKPQAIGASPYR